MIRQYTLADMSADEVGKLCARSETDISLIREQVRPILEAVRVEGDKSLVKFTQQFDKVNISGRPLEVTQEEIEKACDALPEAVRNAVDAAADNIRRFHEAQLPDEIWFKDVAPGVLAGEKITPISSVGLYVPRGKGSFPSVMLMLAIPAVVAQVPEVVVVTPPSPDGGVDDATIYAAVTCGIKRIFRVGGPHAIAALAYGTQSVPRVRKILGPGNAYVSAAKRELYGRVDVGTPAGPSESIILTDGSVSPAIVAGDLLIEAEHGPDSAALLVTTDPSTAQAVARLLPGLIEKLPPERRSYCEKVMAGYGGIVVAADMQQAIAFVNEFAPEHLEVLVGDPFAILPQLRNAGEILLGRHSVITLGNYCLGVNAILPTGGFAHTFSCVTVFDYLKRTSIGFVTAEGYARLAPIAKTLADYEGFPAHANAIAQRN
jgi:histidinol dehydrogenase